MAVRSLHPNKPAILFEDRCWTFQEVDEYANKVANFFLELGVQRGDTVALFMTNCPEYVGLLLGLGKIGVRSALINCNLKEESLLHCITMCNPKAIVYSPTLGGELEAVLHDLSPSLHSRLYCLHGQLPTVAGSTVLEEKLASASEDLPPRPKDLTDKGKRYELDTLLR